MAAVTLGTTTKLVAEWPSTNQGRTRRYPFCVKGVNEDPVRQGWQSIRVEGNCSLFRVEGVNVGPANRQDVANNGGH